MKLTNIRCERLFLNAPDLPLDWNMAYAVSAARKAAFVSGPGHRDSFFNPTSETAMTTFMLGLLEGWHQARMAESGDVPTPRRKDGDWNKAFFQALVRPWTSQNRSSHLGTFLAELFQLDHSLVGDPLLLFEIAIFNHAFNGGETIRNPSFLEVPGDWSRFDALVILPKAKLFVFVESKLRSDGTHGAGLHDLPQPIRNLETAFFVTHLIDSQYYREKWDFRYLLLCPDSHGGTKKECERFFCGGYESALKEYDDHLLSPGARIAGGRDQYREGWIGLRQNLKQRLAVAYWGTLMDRLCQSGFNPENYFRQIEAVDKHDGTLVKATQSRWKEAGINLPPSSK